MRALSTTMKICEPSKWLGAESEALDRKASLTGPYFKYRGPLLARNQCGNGELSASWLPALSWSVHCFIFSVLQ